MIPYQKFELPPIREAIVDARVMPVSSELLKAFESPPAEFLHQYPNKDELRVVSGHAQVNLATGDFAGGEGVTRQAGFIFKSNDGLDVVQFRLDGFTFNRLMPYTSWEDIKPKALRALDVYNSLVSSPTYTRLALRYINRISLPAANLELEDYMSCPPAIPEGAPKSVAGFLTRVEIVDAERGLFAVLIQTLGDSGNQELVDWIVDIDAYCPLSLKGNNEKIQTTFEHLRKLKNDVFFGSLESKVMEIIT